MDLPKPDVLYGLPFADYDALKCVNRRALSYMNVCPAYCHYKMTHKEIREESPALAFGRLFHTACLEPMLFNAVPMPKFGRKKEDLEKKAWFEEEHRGQELISEDDYRTLCSMRDAFQSLHLYQFRYPASRCEVTLVWSDKETGVRCKARPDMITEIDKAVYDLKTTRDISSFHTEIFRQGYYLQAAWYLDAAIACGFKVDKFVFVGISKEPPYLTRLIELHPTVIEIGRASNARLLKSYAACELTGMWPGYEGPELLHPPAWMAQDLANVIGE